MKECKHLSLKGVFHAFSGSIETFRELQKLGDWYIGIGGVLTYKKSSIAETVKQIPLDRILLETDSPYLTPAPHRGKRNESSYMANETERAHCKIDIVTLVKAFLQAFAIMHMF